jgi:hypothetical protein
MTPKQNNTKIEKYDSLTCDEQDRCCELIRDNDDAQSDDEDDVQALVGFAKDLDDLEIQALLLHARYGSDRDGDTDVDSALSIYNQLDRDQQARIISLLE